MARWYLLWAIGLNGHGRVPLDLLAQPWTRKPNRSKKYLHLPSAAAWAVTQLNQGDKETIDVLMDALARKGDSLWLKGDFIGALTGQRFGYDIAAWKNWREKQRTVSVKEMIKVPEGNLLMGSDDGEPSERPAHQVALSTFLIDPGETTNAEFAEFVATTGYVTDAENSGVGWHWEGRWHQIKGADWRHPHGPSSSSLERHPVVQVSWNDARAYCRWHGKRLPTEAEWERAARGDGERVYPWGDDPPRQGHRYRASYGSDDCCRADVGDSYRFTAPVGSFPLGRSPFGIEDLAGNVWEWVQDGFDETYYRRSPSKDPVNDTPATQRVIRGGGWGNDAQGLRSTLRHTNLPNIGLSMVGFRCAR